VANRAAKRILLLTNALQSTYRHLTHGFEDVAQYPQIASLAVPVATFQEWTFWLLVTLKMPRGGLSDPPRAFFILLMAGFLGRPEAESRELHRLLRPSSNFTSSRPAVSFSEMSACGRETLPSPRCSVVI
jgi:hypothetical protein